MDEIARTVLRLPDWLAKLTPPRILVSTNQDSHRPATAGASISLLVGSQFAHGLLRQPQHRWRNPRMPTFLHRLAHLPNSPKFWPSYPITLQASADVVRAMLQAFQSSENLVTWMTLTKSTTRRGRQPSSHKNITQTTKRALEEDLGTARGLAPLSSSDLDAVALANCRTIDWPCIRIVCK